MTTLADLTTPCKPNWCPGCGDFGIWTAFRNAATKENWNVGNTVITAGIGCHGHIINFVKLPAFEGLHGRALPVATGVKMANHKLNVFVFTGDGDSLGEGGNHWVHTCRRNHDITIILHDNAIYGLTTGQTSPASQKGFKSKSTPEGNPDEPIRPLALAIAAGATFVARGSAYEHERLTELIIAANNHKGIAIIDVLQACMSFNPEVADYYKANTYYLGDDYNPKDKNAAFTKALEWGEKSIPLGILYKEEKPSYEMEIPQIAQKPLVSTPPLKRNIQTLFKQYL